MEGEAPSGLWPMADPVRVRVNPGVCGFPCSVCARREAKWSVSLEIRSECKHTQRFGELLKSINLRGLFSSIRNNPVTRAAEEARCHASCPVPLAVIKAAEVAMGMALPRDVKILFDPSPWQEAPGGSGPPEGTEVQP